MITTCAFFSSGPRSFPEQNRAVGDFVSAIIWGEAGRVKDYCSMAVLEDGRLIARHALSQLAPFGGAGLWNWTSASLSEVALPSRDPGHVCCCPST